MAFLNEGIDKEVYVELPEGFNDDEDLVCMLLKSLCSLKQSPRLWNGKINKYLIKNGFKRCINDQCIYYKKEANGIIFIGIWVDDIIIVASKNLLHQMKHQLMKEYKMTDLGEASFILGINITRDRKKQMIYLNQP